MDLQRKYELLKERKVFSDKRKKNQVRYAIDKGQSSKKREIIMPNYTEVRLDGKEIIEFSNMVIITIPFERCSIKRLEHKSQIIQRKYKAD